MSDRAERRAAEEPRAFDFRQGATSPRPHLRTLARMHDVMTELGAAGLARTLRADVSITPVATEIVGYDDYVRSMPQVTVLARVGLSPLEGAAAVELNAQLALVMIERLLGGDGSAPALRRLTDLESTVARDLLSNILGGIRATFDPLVAVEPTIESLVFDPEFLSIAEPSDSVVLLAFELDIVHEFGRTQGVMTVAYPAATIEPVLHQLAAHDEEEAALPWREGPLATAMPDVVVPVRVRLATSPLPARDLVELRTGDVLRLDHRVGRPATAFVGDAPIFEGHVGRRGERRAVEITGRYEPPEHDQSGPAEAGPEELPGGASHE